MTHIFEIRTRSIFKENHSIDNEIGRLCRMTNVSLYDTLIKQSVLATTPPVAGYITRLRDMHGFTLSHTLGKYSLNLLIILAVRGWLNVLLPFMTGTPALKSAI
jgi:hypothetical protein